MATTIDKRIGFNKKKESTNKINIIPVEVKFLKYSFSIFFFLEYLKGIQIYKGNLFEGFVDNKDLVILTSKIYKQKIKDY